MNGAELGLVALASRDSFFRAGRSDAEAQRYHTLSLATSVQAQLGLRGPRGSTFPTDHWRNSAPTTPNRRTLLLAAKLPPWDRVAPAALRDHQD